MTKCWANVSVYGPTLSQHTMVCRLKVAEERDAENDVVIKTTGTSSPQANNSILSKQKPLRETSQALPNAGTVDAVAAEAVAALGQGLVHIYFSFLTLTVKDINSDILSTLLISRRDVGLSDS